MAKDVTNSEVDTLAAAVPSNVGGPLTRVSDVESFPMPNSEQNIEFTTAAGNTIYLTHLQLTFAPVVARKIRETEAISRITQDIKVAVDALDTTMNAYSLPHTRAEYRATIGTLRAIRQTANF